MQVEELFSDNRETYHARWRLNDYLGAFVTHDKKFGKVKTSIIVMYIDAHSNTQIIQNILTREYDVNHLTSFNYKSYIVYTIADLIEDLDAIK